jgi:TP53 regulating kinase-like protein
MVKKLIAQGAEAIITLNEDRIIKDRISKSYRLKEIDDKLRESRTKKEAKILEKAHKIINVPLILKKRKYEIDLEFIEGDKLAEKLNSYPLEKQLEVMKKVGIEIAKLHSNDIIHGDLTTSNMILKEDKVFIIDFGLGFISKRTEDKAVDLHLLKQALEAKHFQNYEKLFQYFLQGYKQDFKEAEKILERYKKVESRGRYKNSF